ncbi:hypothetical protein RHMOL_Rhmol10G0016900 [Rhododendron molle]|uniref:Uncharacterized protein n=1 Tax=Rhododendron molle TaxID=49168 RepID=A0ACC0LY49_RHOML|nr:hypothetical protein RHMOL_Rhmol10G0016900 [Rhododendron molle]
MPRFRWHYESFRDEPVRLQIPSWFRQRRHLLRHHCGPFSQPLVPHLYAHRKWHHRCFQTPCDIFYFHGGGFILFRQNSMPFDELCRHLAGKLPAIVVSINYRLAPEHRYPCQFEDGFDTLKFIDSNCSLLPPNADLSRCFFAGESAGANIAHHVTLKAAVHDFRKLKIVGLIAIQPYFGGEERTESERRLTKEPVVNVERTDWSWKALLPEGCDRDHEAVNVFGVWRAEIERYFGFELPGDVVGCWRVRPVARLAEEIPRRVEEIWKRSLLGGVSERNPRFLSVSGVAGFYSVCYGG